MKAVISTIGKFSSFDIARQLLRRDMLAGVYTAYPRFKLRGEGIPDELLHCFPYLQAPFMARERFGIHSRSLSREWAWYAHTTLDAWVSRRLPVCDVFVGLSAGGLFTGRVAKERGTRYVCHRGSAHIRAQSEILKDEYARFGFDYDPVDPRVIDREEAEYELADVITVPSEASRRTYLEKGIAPDKVRCVNYGVNVKRFEKVADPDPETFEVLFVGGAQLRKGVPYLLEAFGALDHPRKHLRFIGGVADDVRGRIQAEIDRGVPITMMGHVPQPELKDIMSRHHAIVLPSVEDGFGNVIPQAMACGCPPIVSLGTGAADVVKDGENGFIVPDRDPSAIEDRLRRLMEDRSARDAMGQAALESMRSVGGWDQFGDAYIAAVSEGLR